MLGTTEQPQVCRGCIRIWLLNLENVMYTYNVLVKAECLGLENLLILILINAVIVMVIKGNYLLFTQLLVDLAVH